MSKFPDNQQKLITSILPMGRGHEMLKKLRDEKGIYTANLDTARGMGKLTPDSHRTGAGSQTEKDILNVVIDSDRADEVFEYIYETAQINKPHGGMIFMTRLRQASPYNLPELPDES